MPVSTMGIGITAGGVVERYVPPKVIEETGGGGGPPPGPGPLLSSAVAPGPFIATGAFASWVTLALPAGTFDVWARFQTAASVMAMDLIVAISLNGTTTLPASQVTMTFNTGGGSVTQAATRPVEIILAAPQTVHIGGSILTGGATSPVNVVQLFARQLA